MWKKNSFWIGQLVLMIALSACGAAPAPGGSEVPGTVASPPVATATTGVEPMIEESEVEVGAISVQIQESSPLQAQAVVSGTLPDACSFVERVEQAQEGNRLTLTLLVARQPNQRCAPQRTPFEQVVPLEVAELPGGSYEVASHGVVAEFTLP